MAQKQCCLKIEVAHIEEVTVRELEPQRLDVRVNTEREWEATLGGSLACNPNLKKKKKKKKLT